MYWGRGLGVATALIWIGVAGYLLTLAHRLVRVLERIADKWVSRP
jgi:CcmD family protein